MPICIKLAPMCIKLNIPRDIHRTEYGRLGRALRKDTPGRGSGEKGPGREALAKRPAESITAGSALSSQAGAPASQEGLAD